VSVAYKGNTTCFEGNEEDGHSGVVHEMLNCRISLLGRHTSFKSADLRVSLRPVNVRWAHIESSSSKSKSDQIEERNELRASHQL
jgi:hypothetical protein